MLADAAIAPVFDPVAIEKLRKVAGDQGDTFIAEIAQLFLEEAGKSVEEMRLACEQANWLKVGHLAHSMKSSAATLGLMRLSEACRDLERAGQGPLSTPATPALASEVIHQFERAIPTLKKLS